MMGRTKVAEWPFIFPNQFVAGCDAPVQQRGDLEPLLDMTHKTNGQEEFGSSEPSGSFAVRSRANAVQPGQSVGTDHNDWLIHQYVLWDTRLRSDGPKGKGYGLTRIPLDQSEFWLDHQSWLGEWGGEDGLWFGRFDRLDVVPALVPFRTLAG
ncbi:hypothetical protein F2Q69_00043058 [Brassica cretica]|uniref:Uncharacterized protein n=1 Tax=Brassica cretica TaxID=69181 RepID=A0A8S9NHJ8_BRACR|nr:hypothetical protein F2Q69_00043058 [Brassica cretica]